MPFQLQRVKRPQVMSDSASVQGGNSVGQRDKQNLKPLNEKLWHMITLQAKAKFVRYPSPTASAWVHKQYVQKGGRFVDTAKESRRKKAQKVAEKVRESRKKHHGSHE